jgi:hypothetical protein
MALAHRAWRGAPLTTNEVGLSPAEGQALWEGAQFAVSALRLRLQSCEYAFPFRQSMAGPSTGDPRITRRPVSDVPIRSA